MLELFKCYTQSLLLVMQTKCSSTTPTTRDTTNVGKNWSFILIITIISYKSKHNSKADNRINSKIKMLTSVW